MVDSRPPAAEEKQRTFMFNITPWGVYGSGAGCKTATVLAEQVWSLLKARQCTGAPTVCVTVLGSLLNYHLCTVLPRTLNAIKSYRLDLPLQEKAVSS